jgi:FMN-dependent NADH-azoreductase
MWNFGIPYKLKQWFDIVIQPGLTFRFDPALGYLPLLKDRPTIVILASGSDFATGMNRGRIDMATPYLREALRFIGISDVRFVPIGPTAGPAEPIQAARTTAHRRLADMAKRF